MAMQQQNATFAGKLGARVAAAHAKHADAPVDTGMKRLPPGIRGGVAKISGMYIKVQDKDDGIAPKGEPFFRAYATVLWPLTHNGERVADLTTQLVIPLCDTPAKGERKAVAFDDHWFKFQNFFKWFNIAPPNEHGLDAAASARIEAYYMAAMQALTDPQRPPLFVEFSTRGWTPPLKPGSPLGTKNEEMVFETWHGTASEELMAKVRGQFTPGGGVTDNTSGAASNGQVVNPAAVQPSVHSEPPTGIASRASSGNSDNNAVTSEDDTPEEVMALVEVAMNDPEGATDEGMAAHARLEELAWQHGYNKEDTSSAADWATIGDMILQAQGSGSAPLPTSDYDSGPSPGDKYKFAKRDKNGVRLKNPNNGAEFPPQEVTVVTVDQATKTCTLKSSKNGKDVMDLTTKKPAVVKWEWLE